MRPIIGGVVAAVLVGGIVAATFFAGLPAPLLYAAVGVVLGLVFAIDAHRRKVEVTFPAFALPPIGVFAILAYGWPVALPFYLHMTRPEAAAPPPRPARPSVAVRPSIPTPVPNESGDQMDPDAPVAPRPRITRARPVITVSVSAATVAVAAFALLVPVTAGARSIVRTLSDAGEGAARVRDDLRAQCLAIGDVSRAAFTILVLDVHRAVGVDYTVFEPASADLARTAFAAHPRKDWFTSVQVRYLTFRNESSLEPDSVLAWYDYPVSQLEKDDGALESDSADDAHARQFLSLVLANDSTARAMLDSAVVATDTVLGSAAFRARFDRELPDSVVRMSCGSFAESDGARRQRYLLHYGPRLELFDIYVADRDTTRALLGYRHMQFDNSVLEYR